MVDDDTAGARPGGSYADRWIRCTDTGIAVRGYYFPWGTKHIPYGAVRGTERVDLSAARGRARIWGTANPGYWASFDPGRTRKKQAVVLDLGTKVRPFLTPDDPDAFEAVGAVARGGVVGREGPSRGPLI